MFQKVIVVVLGVSASLVHAQFLEFRPTHPVCATYPGKPVGAFCTRSDVSSSIQDPEGPAQSILREISHPQNKDITLATMTFSNRSVATALCQAEARGVEVQVLIDAEAEDAVAKEVQACGGAIVKVGGADNRRSRGDLHHNKFLLIDRKSGDSTLVFSSANFSNPGLSINHETWSFVTAAPKSPFIQNHRCLVEALVNDSSSRRTFRSKLESCLVSDESESIRSFFLPTMSAPLVQEIQEGLRNSKRIWLSSNRFSFVPIIQSFEKRSSNKDSRAVFDDDLFWGGDPSREAYRGNQLDAERIALLKKAGVTVRYMQTSFEAAQKMHSKFLVFDDKVIVGAGNFTSGGLQSNFENFYVIDDRRVVQEFASYFEALWRLSSSPEDIQQP